MKEPILMLDFKSIANFMAIHYDDFIIGISSGLIATFFTWVLTLIRKTRNDKEMFGKIQGEYSGYSYKEGNPWELETDPQSSAEITYIKENLLGIKLNHWKRGKGKWEGTIILSKEHENIGIMHWKYEELDGKNLEKENKIKLGFRRIIVHSPELIYTVGEGDYGEEVFKRK